jgi:hypothetical protein
MEPSIFRRVFAAPGRVRAPYLKFATSEFLETAVLESAETKTGERFGSSLQKLVATGGLDANVGAIMKRHLVWFESPDVAGPSEAEGLEAKGIEQRFALVEKLRGEDLSRLQRAVISDPVARVNPPARRGRGRRAK